MSVSITVFLVFVALACAYRENGCKITAFRWIDQIFCVFFRIFFVSG